MFLRILLALDSGDAGSVATSFTVALAQHSRASVHVVHVNKHLIGGRGLMSESPAEAADVVAAALQELHSAGLSATGVTYRTTRFDLPSVVCDLAERVRADVIVLGSRRRRRHGIPRGGLRDRIARRTPLPVVTAPAPLRVARHDRTFADALPPDISVRS
ncbi:MAG: universal stress protein [Acidimicrobiales bacterium]